MLFAPLLRALFRLPSSGGKRAVVSDPGASALISWLGRFFWGGNLSSLCWLLVRKFDSGPVESDDRIMGSVPEADCPDRDFGLMLFNRP